MTTWDGKIVTLSEITARLKTKAAPAEARHKQVLGVLNAVRAAGIEKVSFESQTPQP